MQRINDITTRYNVIQQTPAGEFIAVMAGMGRNAGTWDTQHGRSQAYAHARKLRQTDPQHRYVVTPAH